jgi:hypothetical protein
MKIRRSGGELGLAFEPILARRLHIGALLFARVSGRFLRVMSRRSRNFQTAVRTILTARSSARRSTISSSVMPGAAARSEDTEL